MRKNYPDFLMHECNAHICCLYFITSNLAILHPRRPLESKNKPKPFASPANESLDATTARRNTPTLSSQYILFFAFAGAQCRQQQRVPLKFTQFMNVQELREAILREVSHEGSPYKDLVYYDGNGEMFFRGGWPRFA
jgi:hypothetical protein